MHDLVVDTSPLRRTHLDADLCRAFDSFLYVSEHLSVVQQIHDIVEVSAEALSCHDTGVLAKYQGVLFGAFACGCKV